jgi:predicted MPP superfamily phosphohydrolase
MSESIETILEKRLGRLHARQRLGIEADNEAKIFGQGINFFHLENWYSIHSVIRNCFRLIGLHKRGKRNAVDIRIRHNDIKLTALPEKFNGFTILQISDPHVDMDVDTVNAIIHRLENLDYDICVLTGDYRAKTFGNYDAALKGMKKIKAHLTSDVYAVLGNHDTIRMVPGLEDMGIRVLVNEATTLERDGDIIHLIGIDDAHYYRVDNIEKAAHHLPHQEFSILLSHTPEIYRHAAHADFNVMLCGHTHGGQICLPGGFPIMLDAKCPRSLGKGAWQYHEMTGYTSAGAGTCIVGIRLNCPPEITLHHFYRA